MPRITRWTAVTAVASATVLAAASGAGAAEGSAARAQSAPRPVYWSAQPQGVSAAAPRRLLNQPVRITNDFAKRPTTQCLDVDANGGGNGTVVQVWQCNGTTQQRWYLWNNGALESYRFPGKCLDADLDGAGSNGTKVQIWDCNSTPQQSWSHPSGDRAIYNARFYGGGNIVMDRDANVLGNGARIQLWQKNFQSQQWWDVWAD
ncbi:ricin-type beta-trefoil lectin domain protein [Streptomyces flavotricini]|uniref:Ricin-type beta-trefoil lectin domain protein n=1 Tax=Streptomyces flavotricini TaxID=66888 RepID=A0ABS8DY65_9ACTN|nr:RICIN domain-containing protein [Streptomyces flavotricini]MCC0093800.1 ricin-type beta-trefoil lectin domain protein [Streptomyces flavotricini]